MTLSIEDSAWGAYAQLSTALCETFEPVTMGQNDNGRIAVAVLVGTPHRIPRLHRRARNPRYRVPHRVPVKEEGPLTKRFA